MTTDAHFITATSWEQARALLGFGPLEPAQTAGHRLRSLRIHVRDHRRRELPPDARTLEAHYGGFVLSQRRAGAVEARRLALDVAYGRDPRETRIAGRSGRLYELGPEPEPDDVDGRSPTVVTWHDGETFYLIASGELEAKELLRIAESLYTHRRTARPEEKR